jgi:LysM repeat protein
MNDEDQTGRGTPGAHDAPVPGAGAPGGEDPEDALRSLERLEALARGEAPPPAAPVRPSPPPKRKRPRVAAAPRPAQTWARIAAPVAFLVAVIVVVSIAFQSGVVGGDEKQPAKPVAKATKTKSPKPTSSAKPTSSVKPTSSASAAPDGVRIYTVKAGDTLSGIAGRFDVTVTEIEELNPNKDLTTLQPGQKLKIPPK